MEKAASNKLVLSKKGQIILSCALEGYENDKLEELREIFQRRVNYFYPVFAADDFGVHSHIIAKGNVELFLFMLEILPNKNGEIRIILSHDEHRMLRFLLVVDEREGGIDK